MTEQQIPAAPSGDAPPPPPSKAAPTTAPPPPPGDLSWRQVPPVDGGHRPPARPGPSVDEAPRRPWRDRLPELVGGIGTILVLAAVVGFVSATWEELDRYGRSLVLFGATGGITAAALFIEQRRREQLASLTSMLWLAGAGTLGASATLAFTELLDGGTRTAVALAGVLAAGYALSSSRRAPGSSLRQLGIVGGLLYAAGPFGTGVADTYGLDDLATALDPVVALFVRDVASQAFALTGTLHLVVGAGWLLWATRTTGRASRVAWVGSTVVLTYAALELHALPNGIGAFGALLVVLGYLVFGLVNERGGAVAVGATGVLIAGSRVLWSLFSGEVATTIASFTVGLALLAWAVRARSGPQEGQIEDTDHRSVTDEGVDAPTTPVVG